MHGKANKYIEFKQNNNVANENNTHSQTNWQRNKIMKKQAKMRTIGEPTRESMQWAKRDKYVCLFVCLFVCLSI
jgi:hypothetical protein